MIVKWAWQQHFHPPVSYWKLIAMSAHSIELTIACFLQGTVKKIPRLIIEVKTGLSATIALESGSNLAQMLVQGYYCMVEHSLDNIVVGLCDEAQFHLFGLDLVKKTETAPLTPLVKILWYVWLL